MYSLNPNKMLTEIISKTAGRFYELVSLRRTNSSKKISCCLERKKLILINLFLICNDIYIFMK